MSAKLMPTRDEFKKLTCIADLDEFSPAKYTVKLLNQEFEFVPLTGENLRAMEDAQVGVIKLGSRLQSGEKVTAQEIVETYFSFCVLAIPELKLEHCYKMTSKQLSKLLLLCLKFVGDQDFENEFEKKNPELPTELEQQTS